MLFLFFQEEDGIRDLVRSRGLGDVYKRQAYDVNAETKDGRRRLRRVAKACEGFGARVQKSVFECDLKETAYVKLRHDLLKIIDEGQDDLCLLYTSDAADDLLCVELGGRRIIKKKNKPPH